MKKNRIRIIMALSLLGLFFPLVNVIGQDENNPIGSPEIHAAEVIEQAAEHHDGGMEPLFFVIIALIIGAATRHFLRKSPLPFTVMLLLIGIGLGILLDLGYFTGAVLGSFGKGLEWAGHIDPHLILFVFLPILIFEAAFAMDVHTFKKSVGNAAILAVPGIVLALVMTAAIVLFVQSIGLGFSGWTWAYALMFGAVVSATDPVAVVALLKELGASKKLGTLIEGESLLNDGTAIVIFMVIYLPIIGSGGDGSPLLQFLYVACGGTLIGIITGYVVMAWVKRVFNDAFVEISVIIAAAYLVFYVAEGFLHVSGVLGLVAYGLVMAGVGKTKISPEVGHFLHEFWELAAFIANVLIFIIVGVVIVERGVLDASANDYLLLLVIYISIHVVRGSVIGLFYPIMKRTGYGLPKKDAVVVWYGALRGAIGLALALIVAGIEPSQMAQALNVDEATAVDVIDQFLFLISGVVALTLLVNATTIKALVKGLGLTKIPPAKASMLEGAIENLKGDTNKAMELMQEDRFMGSANWEVVREYLPNLSSPDISEESVRETDTLAETRRRVLEKEKSSYWHQFNDGILGSLAVRRLSEGVSEVLDHGGSNPLTERDYLDKLWGTPRLLQKFQHFPLLGAFTRRELYNRLAMSYDIAKGFVVAQQEIGKLVDRITKDEDAVDNGHKIADTIMAEIDENRIKGLDFIMNIRNANPEIAAAIETRQAIRSMLNYERQAIKQLMSQGRIDEGEAMKMVVTVENRMKKLMDSPPAFELPSSIELLKEISWLKGLDTQLLDKVVDLTEERLYNMGDTLVKEGEEGDGLFIIARGTVRVSVNGQTIDILGAGTMIGEMAVLTGVSRTATVTAETPITAMWMKAKELQGLMNESPTLTDQLWNTAGRRFAENFLSGIEPYSSYRQIKFRAWLMDSKVFRKNDFPSEKIHSKGKELVLITGSASSLETPAEVVSAPSIIELKEFTLSEDARVFVGIKENL